MGRRYYSTGKSAEFTTGQDFNLIAGVTSTTGSVTVSVASGGTDTNYWYTPNLHPSVLKFRSYTSASSFDTGTGFNGQVTTIAPTSDGKVYVGGEFTTYNGATNNRIIRLNSDGTKDTTFDNSTGFNGLVWIIVPTSDGKVYVGGGFSTYKGSTNNRIIRLNSDGTKDTGFDSGTGFDDFVYAIGVTSDEKLYVGGEFSTYKGLTENHIIRLNSDGTKDTGFDNSTGFTGYITCIVPTSDGKVYVGGGFSTYKGSTNNNIIRLNSDGAKDTGFDNSTGFNNAVESIALTSDGKVYVGGRFTTYKGSTNNYIIRLNSDGTKDTGFDNSTGFDVLVLSLESTPDGKVYVGGIFTTYKGATNKRIIRLNSDGTKDTGFDNNTGFTNDLTDTVDEIVLASDEKVYVGGYFNQYKSVTHNHLIRLNTSGSTFTTPTVAVYTGTLTSLYPQLVFNLVSGSNLILSCSLEKIDSSNNLIKSFNASSSITLPVSVAQTEIFTTVGASTSTVPAGATTAIVRAWGGGGGGGGRNTTGIGGAGGGGGGAYATASFSVTAGQTISVNVGNAGAAGGTANGTGGAGGNSTATYASVVRVNAGGGGGGTGGVSGAAGAAGVVNVGTGFSGGSGAAGSVTVGGGGGGGAGTTGAGGNASGVTAGTGTALFGGDGGNGGNNTAGTAGVITGGAGGGASRTSGTTARAGGQGRRGRVEIEYTSTAPTYSAPQMFYFPNLDLGEFTKTDRLRIKLVAQNTSATTQTFVFNHQGTYVDFPANTIQRRST